MSKPILPSGTKNVQPSQRSRIEPFIAMDVFADASQLEAQGRQVVRMEIGQPGAPAPKAVLDAAHVSLATGRLGYTEALGIPALRERIAEHYRDTYGVDVSADNVVVTTGSSAAFNLAFLAAFDTGARIALAAPGYPAYRNMLSVFGLKAVELANLDERWALTARAVATAHGEKPLDGVLIASPANPTGTMMRPDDLRDLTDFCSANDVTLISDEIYHGLTYEGAAETALRFSCSAIVINSFSKYYCMTGWRIGWMVVPASLLRPIERIAQNIYISVPEMSQRAALVAFDCHDELEQVRQGYAENRRLLLEALPRLGFEDMAPADGAFYIYASARRFSNDSPEFCRRMLHEAGVAATPGVDFDPVRGHTRVRFSFAGSSADIAAAIERLEAWLT